MPKAVEIAHVVYECTDLDRMQAFLEDFGMLTAARSTDLLVMRGAGTSPALHVTRLGEVDRFVGGALEVESRADLDALAAMPGSSGRSASETGSMPTFTRAVTARVAGSIRSIVSAGVLATKTRSPALTMGLLWGLRKVG